MYMHFFPGDHVRIVRLIYNHHFVVMDVHDDNYVTVVHYNAKAELDSFLIFPEIFIAFANYFIIIGSICKFGILLPAQVRKQKIKVNPKSETVQILRYSPNETVFSKTDILKRANSKIGHNEYNLFWNNCESFINWITIGKSVSNQGKNAAIAAVALLFAGVVLVIACIVLLTGHVNSGKMVSDIAMHYLYYGYDFIG